MTDEQKRKPPSHDIFIVHEGSDGKSYFTRIGAAFPHGDERGYSLDSVATPTKGRLIMRDASERLDRMREDPQPSTSAQQQEAETQPQAQPKKEVEPER